MEVPFAVSEKLDRKYNMTPYDLSWKINDFQVRTQIIETGRTEYQFNLNSGGELCQFLIGGLLLPEAYYGSFEHSATNFQRRGCSKIEILVNEEILPGYPIKCEEGLVTSAYVQYLKVCKWYHNNLAAGFLNLFEFEQSNFLIAQDFSDISDESGWLSIRLQFDTPTEENLIFVGLMISPKTIKMDNNKNFSVT